MPTIIIQSCCKIRSFTESNTGIQPEGMDGAPLDLLV